MTSNDNGVPEGQRLDKWLWYARQVKTRTLAARLIANGRVRVNREKVDKPATIVRPEDVITATINRRVKILKIVEIGSRRGPADEAQQLYEDLTPEETPRPESGLDGLQAPMHNRSAGRPNKRDRRKLVALKTNQFNYD